jgi:hypothetical protein
MYFRRIFTNTKAMENHYTHTARPNSVRVCEYYIRTGQIVPKNSHRKTTPTIISGSRSENTRNTTKYYQHVDDDKPILSVHMP